MYINNFVCKLVSSAGIGRTGVLILMETALCLIETNQPVFPLDIVRQMREQRLGMIQTAV
jgi:protein tyrosine phosphatase